MDGLRNGSDRIPEGCYTAGLEHCVCSENGSSRPRRLLHSAGYRSVTLRRKCIYSPRLSPTSNRLFLQHNISKFLLLFSVLHLSYSSRTIFGQLVVGEEASCDNEGEAIEVGFLKDNPCFQCVCKDGKVQCKIVCEDQPQCYAPINKKDKCCPVCKECHHRRQTLTTSTEWQRGESKNPCERLFCRDGILTRGKRQCFVPCTDPVPPAPTECCPTCKGCLFEGNTYSEGESVMLDDHRACTTCTCKKGSITCVKDPCPVLACKSSAYNVTKDGCCLECVGNKAAPELPAGLCRSADGIVGPGESVTVDECTKCKCKNGTLLCDTLTCPITLRCPQEDWVFRPGECCPMCLQDVPKKCIDSKGRKKKHGSKWTEGRDSCQDCTCTNASITCQPNHCEKVPTSCPKGESLELMPKECCKKCIKVPEICSVFGDPHYRTFDGRPFNFQGDCRYVIAEDCSTKNFTVEVQNDAKTSGAFSWTRAVYMTLMTKKSKHGMKVSLHQHSLTKVNGRKISFPYITRNLVIIKEREIIKVRTKQGVSLNWDGDSFLEVGASEAYKGKMCGLCGNYNGFPRDDFIGGDGTFKLDEVSFAESWKSINGECTRRDYSARSPSDPCAKSVRLRIAALKSCLIFKTPEFRVCYSKVNPMDYYRDCMTDSCECPPGRSCSCESILAYTTACLRKGANVSWSKPNHCEKTCKRGKVYSECGTACKRTCKNYKTIYRSACKKAPCVAGCHCPAGYALHQKKCIRINQCEKALREDTTRRRSPRLDRKRTRFLAKRNIFGTKSDG